MNYRPNDIQPSNEGTLKQKRRSITTEFQVGDWEKPFVETFGEEYYAYRRAWEQSGPGRIPQFPLHIDFQLMDACNMRCVFCPRDKSVMIAAETTDLLNRGTKMPLEDFRKVIDEGEQYGLRAINLGATAEPLIHPDVVEMVRYARQHGVFDIRVITNGLMLKDKMIRQLYDSGLTYLSISLDAWIPETYRKIRRGDLDKVVANTLLAVAIRQEMQLDFPRIRVSFVNLPESKGEFRPFLEFWKDKVDFIELQDYDNFGAPTCNFSFKCIEPYRRLMVWASGVVGCIAWTTERYPYGYISGQTIKECWESKAINKLRISLEQRNYNTMCLGCYGKIQAKD
jgi:wyosine [tRNA(Phe)-imidazoG37] synthetase (radical SAM superfamily)